VFGQNEKQSKANSNCETLKKNTQKIRSNSTTAPHALQEIVHSSNNNNNNKNIIQQNEKQINQPIIKKFQKTIRKIYPFTHVGFDGEADKENNQDRAFIEKNFAGRNDYIYMSVCDGHGIEGHKVSEYIKQLLPKLMSEVLKGKEIENPNVHQKEELYALIKDVFEESNRRLCDNDEEINSFFSGSTCVSVIYTPTKLICPNIGDSRAVIGKYNAQTCKWSSFELTRDHKPTEQDEAERIWNSGGRIQPFTDEDTGEPVGPQRVWIMEDDVPGLAMTRSFGDIVAASVGVNSVPEITEYVLSEDDKFMLVASDGVWEFISSDECMKMIREYYERNDCEGCCKKLYLESKMRWIKEEEVVDDITMILVFFN
jgi:serine/threonine protein phosphatase PrpC